LETLAVFFKASSFPTIATFVVFYNQPSLNNANEKYIGNKKLSYRVSKSSNFGLEGIGILLEHCFDCSFSFNLVLFVIIATNTNTVSTTIYSRIETVAVHFETLAFATLATFYYIGLGGATLFHIHNEGGTVGVDTSNSPVGTHPSRSSWCCGKGK